MQMQIVESENCASFHSLKYNVFTLDEVSLDEHLDALGRNFMLAVILLRSCSMIVQFYESRCVHEQTFRRNRGCIDDLEKFVLRPIQVYINYRLACLVR